MAAGAVKKKGGSRRQAPIPMPLSKVPDDEALISSKSIIRPYAHAEVDIRELEGRGKGLVASSDLSSSTLLLISRPAAIITGPTGANLDPSDLVKAITDGLGNESVSAAASLSLLFDGSDSRSTMIPSLQQLAQLDISDAPLSEFNVSSMVRCNAYGEPYGDPSAWTTRGQGGEFCSFLGVWPAFALLNHSCSPNASTMVLRSSSGELMMLVRACRDIKAGEEISIAYAEICKPLSERRSHLKSIYLFDCACSRCKREEEISLSSPEITRDLMMAHEELLGPLTVLTYEALTPIDNEEELEELNSDEHEPIERDVVSRIKALLSRTQVAIWHSSFPQDIDNIFLSSWMYKAYELLSMICIGNEFQVPFHRVRGQDKQSKKQGSKVKVNAKEREKRSGLGGTRRRMALISRDQDRNQSTGGQGSSRAVRDSYSRHVDLMESIRVRHHLLQTIAPGSYQEAALSARLLQITRDICGSQSDEAQRALEKCLASTKLRYGSIKADAVARIVSAHEENDLQFEE